MTALLLPLHVMAVLSLGLLIGQQGWSRAVPAAYAAAVLVGLGAIALAAAPDFAEESLLVATALAGLLLALARSWPAGVGMALGVVVGLLLALDSPPQALALREANLELAGTAAGFTLALWAVAAFSVRLHRDWQRLGARILGSWIAASAVLVLALRLLR